MEHEPKAILHRYLRHGREALSWKLDGLSEYDVRRPLTASGTNLLGLVKHLAGVELGYFGECFGRPSREELPRLAQDAEPNDDMWATPDESRADVIARYERAAAHSDATIEALALDAEGAVPWWPDEVNPVTLHTILVHVTAETHRHAGHADIVRETIDGRIGHRPAVDNLPDVDAGYWPSYVARVEAAAREAAGATE
jgi:hypothetical protein